MRTPLATVVKKMDDSYEDKCNTPSKVGEYVLRLIENSEGIFHSGRSPIFVPKPAICLPRRDRKVRVV